MSKIIAVDFDGVLCTDCWPEIGFANELTIDLIKKLKKKGYKLILWTCRSGKKLEEAVEFCRIHGIEFDAVNENLPECVEQFGGDSRKIYADFYIDDRNIEPGILELCIDYLAHCSFI